uniref:Uncharacterized protein n=1 Tax=Ananas comosus var. bracteatus TaxID=296719 RepID=A0A6V7NW35_ANACO|nr:unnamed protein product [Ananas comosus var. bracteatus]
MPPPELSKPRPPQTPEAHQHLRRHHLPRLRRHPHLPRPGRGRAHQYLQRHSPPVRRNSQTKHFDKIMARLKKLSCGLSWEHCDPVLVAQKVCSGVTTSQLAGLAAEIILADFFGTGSHRSMGITGLAAEIMEVEVRRPSHVRMSRWDLRDMTLDQIEYA